MATEGTYCSNIEKISKLIKNNKDNLNKVIKNYKNNIDTINNKINSINNTKWKDDVETEYSSYIDYLKNGIVLKLKSSKDQLGTLTTFEKLLKDLEKKCNEYTKTIKEVGYTYTSVCFDETNNNFRKMEVLATKEYFEARTIADTGDITNLNTQFSNLVTSIDEILSKLKELKFDSEIEYKSNNNYDFSMLTKEEPKTKKRKGKTFESPDDAWILIHSNYDGTKRVNGDYWLFNETKSKTDCYWLYNTVSGEFQRVDYDRDMRFGNVLRLEWPGTLYGVKKNNGQEVKVQNYEATVLDPISYIKKYYPESYQDKWELDLVDISPEANEELYGQMKEQYNDQMVTLNAHYGFHLYNPVTNENIDFVGNEIREEEDKYIIETNGQKYIIYKENALVYKNQKEYNNLHQTEIID